MTTSPTSVRDERGAAAVFVMLMTVALLVGAGLVIDGGYALAERRQLNSQAEQAARVGADALDQASLRDGGTPVVDPARARSAAARYLADVGATGTTVSVTGNIVTVTIAGHVETTILSIAGVTRIAVSASASAASIDADTTQ
jgi:Flp pilus assembly protein TadG